MSGQTSEPETRHEFETRLIIKAWQDESFKQKLISNPKMVYERELGKTAPEGCIVTILEENPNQIYFILPAKPIISESDELSELALEAVAGGGPYLIKQEGSWIVGWR